MYDDDDYWSEATDEDRLTQVENDLKRLTNRFDTALYYIKQVEQALYRHQVAAGLEADFKKDHADQYDENGVYHPLTFDERGRIVWTKP